MTKSNITIVNASNKYPYKISMGCITNTKKTGVRNIFSPQQIELSIQHVVSKVTEFTVLAYAEDQ